MEAVAGGSGGSGGTKNPDEGKFTISENNASIMFVDPIGTEPLEDGSIPELSIYVPAGKTANIYVFEDMVLTNENVDRSAIDLDPTATLNLWIKEGAEVNVISGLGKEGEAKNTYGAKGGEGGYAGIHVPEGAELTLQGGGTLIAIGGNAGRGGSGGANGTNSNVGGGGGGGAGAGIGGNGGRGGDANLHSHTDHGYSEPIGSCGSDGEAGENCGTIKIMNSITVYAYAGAGGGVDASTETYSPSGAGGYPAAGIGGGGAGAGGGCHSSGAGGYTGSNGQNSTKFSNENGKAGYKIDGSEVCGNGAGYFENTTRPSGHLIARIGGQGGINDTGFSSWVIDYAGDGGVAGKGGEITVSQTANVYAYNGNKWTDEKHNSDGTITYVTGHEPPITNSSNQLEIYAQNGILREVYKYNSHWGEKVKNGNSHNYLETGIAINSYSYLHSIMGNTIKITGDVTKPNGSSNPLINVLVRDRIEENISVPITDLSYRKIKCGYVNPSTGSAYGIGSGAGYIEVSNGTYTVDPTLN